MLGVSPAQRVEVDPVQDLDPVARAGHRVLALCRELVHGRSHTSRVDALTLPGLARPRQQDEAEALGRVLLVERERREDVVGRRPRPGATGSPCALERRADLVAKLRRIGEAQRREQPEAHRLAVAVAPVARRGLDRVADGVAEVEHGAASGVALVGGDDVELDARAVEDTSDRSAGSRPSSARTRSHSAPPAISAVLSTSANPAASSSGGRVASVRVSARTAAGMW